jgi:MFS family permease
MIVNRQLTEAERDKAAAIYCRYCGSNAATGVLAGLTMQVLVAVSLGMSTAWVSVIGTLNYLSYILLPLGFSFSGKLGVGRNMRLFALVIAVMCFAVALSPLLPKHGVVVFFIAVVIIHCCGSFRDSMVFPLQKNITTDGTILSLLFRAQLFAAVVSLTLSPLLAWGLSRWDNSIALPLLFCAGGGFHLISGQLISRIPEPSILKELAARPVLPQVRKAWGEPLMRKQLLTGTVLNLSLMTMVSVSVVAAKKGCGMDNAQTMALSTIQIVSTIAASYIFKFFTERFGPRKMMIAAYPLLWVLSLYWCLVPSDGCGIGAVVLPFVLGGLLTVILPTALNNYFAITIPNSIQVGGTFLVFTINGGLTSLLGILVNALIFNMTKHCSASDAMLPFRIFYLITGLLFIPGILSVTRLPAKNKLVSKKANRPE